jgi:exodeoxyribonuclease VII large subunit
LPSEINRIGVVTSKSGAVVHDIVTVAHRRNPSVDIAVFDVRVQGDGAETEIANGIEIFNRLETTLAVDVIIVARGGGSAEDLMPFNTEVVARAICGSDIPVVSAVGHESDFTLVDFVSDLRAPTPSAAAELCVREQIGERDRAVQTWEMIKSIIARKIDMNYVRERDRWANLKNVSTARYAELERRLDVLSTRISAQNPIAVLQRGFAHSDVALEKVAVGGHFELTFYNPAKKRADKLTAERLDAIPSKG